VDRRKRIEILIRAYEDDLVGYKSLVRDFEERISELRSAICELQGKRVDAENEIKVLRLILTDPDGNWTPSLEYHEEKRRNEKGWFTPKVLEGGCNEQSM